MIYLLLACQYPCMSKFNWIELCTFKTVKNRRHSYFCMDTPTIWANCWRCFTIISLVWNHFTLFQERKIHRQIWSVTVYPEQWSLSSREFWQVKDHFIPYKRPYFPCYLKNSTWMNEWIVTNFVTISFGPLSNVRSHKSAGKNREWRAWSIDITVYHTSIHSTSNNKSISTVFTLLSWRKM